jgi:hypothetical protein
VLPLAAIAMHPIVLADTAPGRSSEKAIRTGDAAWKKAVPASRFDAEHDHCWATLTSSPGVPQELRTRRLNEHGSSTSSACPLSCYRYSLTIPCGSGRVPPSCSRRFQVAINRSESGWRSPQ